MAAPETIPGQLDEIKQRLVAREKHVDARFDAGELRMRAIESAMAENTLLTREMSGVVQDIKDIVTTGKVTTKAIKWIGAIAAAGAGVWGFVKTLKGG